MLGSKSRGPSLTMGAERKRRILRGSERCIGAASQPCGPFGHIFSWQASSRPATHPFVFIFAGVVTDGVSSGCT